MCKPPNLLLFKQEKLAEQAATQRTLMSKNKQAAEMILLRLRRELNETFAEPSTSARLSGDMK